MAYLYGASVQGIQDFIFKTNKLQEIIGASEIVKGIEDFFTQTYKPKEVLRNAGGVVKAIFEHDECQKIVLNFPKEVMKQAYGITILQAVVKMEGVFSDKKEASMELERLLRIQRNKPTVPLDMSLGLMKLNPRTSRTIVEYDKNNEALDRATQQKREAYTKWFNTEYTKNENIKDFKKISALSNSKNKIAVIHADGNGLGQLIPKLGDKLSAFSVALNEATQKAFDDAKTTMMRDVVLGGDDMTVICNADDALLFTKTYLENFEGNTADIKELNGHADKLTACAGIAYCNEKYPFHYAVSLAESLCSQAKKHSNREASCLMFHNIQSSNYQTWTKFVNDELTIENDKETILCDFGAYYLKNDFEPTVDALINVIKTYKSNGTPISKLREWMGELHKSSEYANILLERINDMSVKNIEWDDKAIDKKLKDVYASLSSRELVVEKDGVLKTPIYDILQILSVTGA